MEVMLRDILVTDILGMTCANFFCVASIPSSMVGLGWVQVKNRYVF